MAEQDIRTVEDLQRKLGEHTIEWSEIAPRDIVEWLEKFSTGNGCMKELTLGTMISITSALTGIAKLRIFSTFEETANLFTILLASPGKIFSDTQL